MKTKHTAKKPLGIRILKVFGISIGSLIVLIALIFGLLILSVLFYREPDASLYAEHWPKDLSYDAADELALDLVSQMSLEEKLDQMTGDVSGLYWPRVFINNMLYGKFLLTGSGENERLHIPPFIFTDGPRGVIVARGTTFPVAMARGASWDAELEKLIGDVMGKETRAAGANYFGGVCINLLRHPAWGRAQETFGEDPWLIGTMGISLTHGVQQHRVMACAKHFALNSIEFSRFKVDVSVDERALREVYLPHFKRVIQDAHSASVMSAYNQVRGEYCGHNKYLLTDILRDDWDFRGFVSSDWVAGLHDGVKGINAGMDVEMPFDQHYNMEETVQALEAGTVSIEQIDEMVRRIVRTKLMYISATDPQEYSEVLLASEPHQALSLESAEKSMVLLKNEKDNLPFNAGQIKTLAVIGELATADNLGDHGSSNTNPPFVIRILDGLQDYGEEKFEVEYHDGSDLESARQTVAHADAVVFVVGYSHNDEGEYIPLGDKEYTGEWGKGGDRPNLSLKPQHQELLKQLLPENENAVVAMIGGSGIMTHEWDALAPSILMVWYPGMMGGKALANILFGEVNPSGKLPLTVPKQEDHLPYFFPDVDSIHYGYYHGYTLLDKKGIEAAYPFGFGLSYTEFEYDSLWLDKTALTTDDTLKVAVRVSNTGDRAGEEIVQVYAGFRNGIVDRPVKLLRGFDREYIEPGETKIVTIPVYTKDLAWYDPDAGQWVVDTMEYEIYAGPSSAAKKLLQASFFISEQ
jgi:beta-glucosidase